MRRKSTDRRRRVALVLSVLICTSGYLTYARQDTPQPAFRRGVNSVRVDVIVTDRKGDPVTDLTPADFELTEAGKPQTIETFKFIRLDGGVADAKVDAPRPIRTDIDEIFEASKDDVRMFGIFLDDLHVDDIGARRVRAPLAEFVEKSLGPSDMVGVMYPRQTLASVRMTRNRAAVAAAIRRFGPTRETGPSDGDLQRPFQPVMAGILRGSRRQISLDALRAFVVHMGSLKEGRKTLILVSSGYSYPGLPAGRGRLTNQQSETAFSGLAQMQLDLREVWDMANRNNVAIYALDPTGLVAPTGGRGGGFSSSRTTLELLAEQTDGRAIFNRNNLAQAMTAIIRDTSAYYLLGYSAQAANDGQFHEVRVKVKRPGVEVRARRGYWAWTEEDVRRAAAPPTPESPPELRRALASIAQPRDGRLVQTWVGLTRGDNGRTRVTLLWDPKPQTFDDRAANGQVPSRLSFVASGDRGRIPYSEGAIESGRRAVFDVDPGMLRLQLTVESGSGTIDVETRDLEVPDLTAVVALGTPELFRARTYIEYRRLGDDPQPMPIATREFLRSDRVMLRVAAYGPGATTPAIRVRLLNRNGQSIRDLVAAPSVRSGVFQVDVPVASLAPGDYVVEIQAEGESESATQAVGFRVIS